MKVFIVDIDGTICTESFNEDGSKNYKNAKPNLERINIINKLFDDGNEIHYWSARGSLTGIDHKQLTTEQLKNGIVNIHHSELVINHIMIYG